jgi:hypothetical protein
LLGAWAGAAAVPLAAGAGSGWAAGAAGEGVALGVASTPLGFVVAMLFSSIFRSHERPVQLRDVAFNAGLTLAMAIRRNITKKLNIFAVNAFLRGSATTENCARPALRV